MRKPLLMRKEPSMSGSLMRPFQPTVVRGFYLGVSYYAIEASGTNVPRYTKTKTRCI